MLAKIKERREIPTAELWIWEVSFRKNRVIMTDMKDTQISLPYRELVAAYLEICEENTGKLIHPELFQVTEELEGCLVLYDREYRRMRVHPVGAGIKAGEILKGLAVHAPYLFLQYMPWMEEGNQEKFFEIRQMVSAMRSVT